MNIRRIYVRRNDRIKVYSGYLELISNQLDYWARVQQAMLQRFTDHLHHVRQHEKALERNYNLERGSLRGAHFIFGSSRAMREGLANQQFRRTLVDGDLRFVVQVNLNNREVKTFTTNSDEDLEIFKTYRMTNNFFGDVTINDPITRVD